MAMDEQLAAIFDELRDMREADRLRILRALAPLERARVTALLNGETPDRSNKLQDPLSTWMNGLSAPVRRAVQSLLNDGDAGLTVSTNTARRAVEHVIEDIRMDIEVGDTQAPTASRPSLLEKLVSLFAPDRSR